MSPGDVFVLLVLAIPALIIIYMAKRFFAFKEKQLEVKSTIAAEQAAQYATRNAEIEQRLRVVEQIVTDSGAQTASQIEALRSAPRPDHARQGQQEPLR